MPRTLLVVVLMLAATAGNAATFAVTRFDDPAMDACETNGCSLREALYAAANNLEADTVTLQAGTYRVLVPAGATQVSMQANGDLTIEGAGRDATTVRSYGPGSIFVAGGSVTFRDLRIRNGSTLGSNTLDGVGAAIRASGADLTLDSVILSDNQTNTGGSLFASYSVVTITGSELHSNFASEGAAGAHFGNSTATIIASRLYGNEGFHGGAIRSAQSSLTLSKGTVIENNEALQGGAILADGELVADDTCVLRGNSASHGGAIYGLGALHVRGVPTANGSGLFPISGNLASSGGGAIAAGSDLRVERVELISNQANHGGGIHMTFPAELSVEDSRIANNTVATSGGGIVTRGTGTIARSAIQGNSAVQTSGALSVVTGSVLALVNVDIYGNTAPSNAAISNFGVLSMTHVTISGNRAGHAFDAVRLGTGAEVTYANSILDGRCTGTTTGITTLGTNLRTTSLLGNNCPGTTASTSQLALRRGAYGGQFEISGTSNAASMLIDAGARAYCVDDDVRTAARDAKCDVGAFEYGAVAP